VTGCSRTNLAVVAQQQGEGGVVDDVVEIAATTGIAYETTEANVPADIPITISFTNPGAIGHNVVVVESEDLIQPVAEAADPTGNVEADVEGVLARTDVIASTTTEAMVEEGLPAGEYVYICTVPGHTQAMQGTLIVE
jgi:azurin